MGHLIYTNDLDKLATELANRIRETVIQCAIDSHASPDADVGERFEELCVTRIGNGPDNPVPYTAGAGIDADDEIEEGVAWADIGHAEPNGSFDEMFLTPREALTRSVDEIASIGRDGIEVAIEIDRDVIIEGRKPKSTDGIDQEICLEMMYGGI